MAATGTSARAQATRQRQPREHTHGQRRAAAEGTWWLQRDRHSWLQMRLLEHTVTATPTPQNGPPRRLRQRCLTRIQWSPTRARTVRRDAPEGLGTGPCGRTEPCDAWLLGSPRGVCSREGLTSVSAGGFDGCQRRWQPCTNWRRACESRVCPVGVERLRVTQPLVASVVGRMRKSIMSRSSSETQSLRRSAQPTRPCAEAHALPHAQRSSVSYALSPPRSHGTAPKPTGPLRRRPSLNLVRPRSGSSRHSHAQRSAVAPAPRNAAPRAHRRHSRTAFGSVEWPRPTRLQDRASRSLFARATGPVSGRRHASRHVRDERRASCAADTASSAGAQAIAACGARAVATSLSQHAVPGACTQHAPCMYAAIAPAQNPCVSYGRAQSFY